jgi:Uma2 family endonuclease
MAVSNLTEADDLLTPLLIAAVDDTNGAPWMTMPEFQSLVIALLAGILRLHNRRHNLGWHVSTELEVSMPKPENRGTLTLGPDLFVVEADALLRTSWDIRAEGKPPAFVLEVVTRESVQRDTSDKPGYYLGMGVQEYAIYWPYRRDHGPRLFGHHLDEEGQWAPWSTDEQGVLWCRTLGGLGLAVGEPPWLRVLDQEGHELPVPEEEALARQAAEERAEREAERAEREAQRAAAAEAEVARLRTLLEGRQG